MKNALLLTVCAALLLVTQACAGRLYDTGTPSDGVWTEYGPGVSVAQRFTLASSCTLDSIWFAAGDGGRDEGIISLYQGDDTSPGIEIASWIVGLAKVTPRPITWTHATPPDDITLYAGQVYWAAIMAAPDSAMQVLTGSGLGSPSMAQAVDGIWAEPSDGQLSLRIYGKEVSAAPVVPEPVGFTALGAGAVGACIRRIRKRT